MGELIDGVRQVLRWSHIVVGFVGLAMFWVPIVTRKGGAIHKRYGTIFAWCAYFVTVSAMVSTTLVAVRLVGLGRGVFDDPNTYGFLLFLFYLGLATFASVRHAVLTVRTKRDPASIVTPAHRALAWASILGSVVVVAFALVVRPDVMIVLLALSPVGLLVGRGMLIYMRDPEVTKKAWFYQHLNAMLGAGIAFHTAFFVFGGAQMFNLRVEGPLGFIPWVAPAAIGIPASIAWERYYRKKFGELRSGKAAA